MSGSLTETNRGHYKVSNLINSLSCETRANVIHRVQLEVTWMLSKEEISEIRLSAADGKNRELVCCISLTETLNALILLSRALP
jgi:hypothetical protein